MRIRIYIIGVVGMIMTMGGIGSTIYGVVTDNPLSVLCGLLVLVGGFISVYWAVKRM